jgi:hypothetical protein
MARPSTSLETCSKSTATDVVAFVEYLREVMHRLKPTPVRPQSQRNVYISDDLSSCTHVFVHREGFRKPLQPPYDGPYGCRKTVSLYRLKPAYLECTPQTPTLLETSPPTPIPPPRVTHSGRCVHFPDRLGTATIP